MILSNLPRDGGKFWRCLFYGPSLVYEALVKTRSFAYGNGLLETVRVPVPVFCMGNLTTGGTGKTPGVIWLARFLQKRGRRPAVVTRGYGRRGTSSPPNGKRDHEECDVLVVSDGRSPLNDVRVTGDEPLLLARCLPGVPVLAGVDRSRAALKAIEDFGVDCLVLDDGYQHLRLHRDLNLLCLDAWGDFQLYVNAHERRLLPAGSLREPLSALRRAHVVFLTKANFVSDRQLACLKETLGRWIPEVPAVCVRYRLSFHDARSLEPQEPDTLKNAPVLALSGLARPASFEEALRRLGADVLPVRYPDHYYFRAEDLKDIARLSNREKRIVVVSEKDQQRLPSDFPCVVARLHWVPEGFDNDDRFPPAGTKSPPWIQKIESFIS